MKYNIKEFTKNVMNRDKTWRYVGIDDIKLDKACSLSIDASTDNTGLSIIGYNNELMYLIGVKKEHNENPVAYKLEYKKLVRELLLKQVYIGNIWYEEHFVQFAASAKMLYMIRSTVEEILIEEKDTLSNKYREVSNKKWKSLLLSMCGKGKCPVGSELEKTAVRECLLEVFPSLNSKEVTQDELDSLGLGLVANQYGETIELESRKKASKFKFEVTFIGADSDEEFFEVFQDGKEYLPKRLLGQGLIFYELNNKEKFENAIYRQMIDEDSPLVMRFNSSKYGYVILQYNISEVAGSNDYIYAVVNRKNRKS